MTLKVVQGMEKPFLSLPFGARLEENSGEMVEIEWGRLVNKEKGIPQ